MDKTGRGLIEKIQQQECFLCKDITPELFIWGNDRFVIALDAFPSVKGHVVLAPKEHIEALSDMSEEMSKELIVLARKLDKSLREYFDPFRVAVVSSGLAVKHLHFHIIPIPNEEMMWGFKYLDKKDIVQYTEDERQAIIAHLKKSLE